MNVAWFTHRYAPVIGGSENYARAMVRRMVADGHGLDVYTTDAADLARFTRRDGGHVPIDAATTIDGASIHRLSPAYLPGQRYLGKLLSYVPSPSIRCQFASYFPILPGLTRIRGNHDLVFSIAFPYTNISYAALRTARAAGAPLVITPFLHLATPGDPVNRAYTRPHQRWLLKQADLVVAATRLEADTIADWGIAQDKILTLPMAVEKADVTGGDGPAFRWKFGLEADAPVVGQLGALDLDKGTVDLVLAMSRLNESRSNRSPAQLLLAGRTTPRFDEFLDRFGSAPWLHLAGPLSTQDCRSFYDAIDLFAMPSRTDSFGIVFLEAWANGKPVVAARAGGVVEVIEDGADGLLVPFGEPEQLAATLGRLLNEPALRDRLGSCGRRRVERGFTWDERYTTLSARLDELLVVNQRNRGPRPHFSADRSPICGQKSGRST